MVLILKENNSTNYNHCFTHQLQLALVVVVKNHVQIATFLTIYLKFYLKDNWTKLLCK